MRQAARLNIAVAGAGGRMGRMLVEAMCWPAATAR
jgi:dihydrodipicolinate reductase